MRTSLIAIPTAPAVLATYNCTVDSLYVSNPTNAAQAVTVFDGAGAPLVPTTGIPALGSKEFAAQPLFASSGFSIVTGAPGLYFSASWRACE